MIAEWMLYCLLASFGLAVAATLAERVLLAGRGPVRLVWIGAVALSLAIPAAAFRFSTRTAIAADTPVATEVATDSLYDANAAAGTVAALNSASHTTPLAIAPKSAEQTWWRNWRTPLNRYDQPLIIIWATLSFALACNFLASVVVLSSMRRTWQRQTLQGIAVFLSERSGPAVVGALSPVIVLPKWALELAPPQLNLMLRHEEQHRLAGDGQLLTIARLALIVMPWNVALWWQVLRLRVAVELDCDARVLQSADARLYGDLLLEVASTGRSGQLMGATAFAERATQLERRIRMLSRHRVRTSRAARAVALGVGVAVLTVAWVAPHPAVPPVAVAPNLVTSTTVTAPPTPTASAPDAGLSQKPVAQLLQGDTSIMSRGIVHADSLIALMPRKKTDSTKDSTRKSRVDSSKMVTSPITPALPVGSTTVTDTTINEAARRALSQQADSALAILFDGITLTRTQEAEARRLIFALQTQQTIQNMTYQLERTMAQLRRDSTLRSLLPETERAILNTRLAPGGRGARSGGGGAPPDSVNGGPPGAGGRGGGGGGGGGRGGGPGGRGAVDLAPGARGNTNGAGRGGNATPQQLEAAAEASFRRMFDGISLTPSQDSIAHAAILTHLQSMVTTSPPPARIRVNLLTRVVAVAAPVDSALIDLSTNSADKAKVRSRLISIPPR